MAYGPLSLWVSLTVPSDPEGPSAGDSPFHPAAQAKPPTPEWPVEVAEWGPIYRMFARHLTWPPRVVDTLEVWEAARMLGVGGGGAVVAASQWVSLEGDGG